MTANILQNASKNLVKTCQKLASKKLTELTEDYERGWKELSASTPAEDLISLSSTISRDRANIRKRLQRAKLEKLQNLRRTSARDQGMPEGGQHLQRGDGEAGEDVIHQGGAQPILCQPEEGGERVVRAVSGTGGEEQLDVSNFVWASSNVYGKEKKVEEQDGGSLSCLKETCLGY